MQTGEENQIEHVPQVPQVPQEATTAEASADVSQPVPTAVSVSSPSFRLRPVTYEPHSEARVPPPSSDLTKPQKFTFQEVETQFEDTYFEDIVNDSAILDVIAIYIKGQKILYTEAKTLCEQRLNYLMLPAIFNTAVCTILSLVLESYEYGPTIVSCLNGFNAFILALINYLKLDARAEAHRNSAYKFDKIQSQTVFNSGKVLFGAIGGTHQERQKKIVEMIDKVEKEVNEIKESNHFVLPERIRTRFPSIYGSNVFAEVKRLMNDETIEMNQLREYVNEREEAHFEYNQAKNAGNTTAIAETKTALDTATTNYRAQVKACIDMRKKYQYVDKNLDTELRGNSSRMSRWCDFCNFLKN